MRTSSFFVLFLALVIVFSNGCEPKKKTSKLLNEKITAQNFFEVIEKARKDSLMTIEDLDYFSSGVARYNNLIDSLYNKSVKEIIEQEKKLRFRQSGINLATNAITAFSRFRYDGWKPVDINGSKFNVFTYTISNISKTDIKKIYGYLQFFTAGNQLVRAYRINIDQTIKGGQFTQFQSTFKFEEGNKNEEFLIKMLTENPQQIFVSWRPLYLELDNGQKVDLEEK
ncbi:MAG: hypothetical protein CH6_3071 [Candidatus Kapaibacterium sp.]|nr:MAG: hypothetical protein CH6_3071 [Candidatus Kapabacteria bacterium]